MPRFVVETQRAQRGLVIPFDAPAISDAAYSLVYPTEPSDGKPLASFRE